MLPFSHIAVLGAWAVVPARPASHQQRHHVLQPHFHPAAHEHRRCTLQLNWLDEYKAEQERGAATSEVDASAMAFMSEINDGHMEELRQVAHVRGTEDGVDWTSEELVSVQVIAVDDRGMLLQEMLCSAADQRCISVDVPIAWPVPMAVGPPQLPEMRQAFAEISRRAYAASVDAMPPEYQRQAAACAPLMGLMNEKFGKLLRFYALKHARSALSPTEQVERATMSQLTFEGLSLELTTLDVAALDSSACTLRRKTWSASILFDNRCQSPYEVESMLIRLFDTTAAAVEEGRISVEGVTPEPMSDTIANARQEQRDPHMEHDDVVTASFRQRDRRLRRAVRTRRAALYNQQTARYIAASRRWASTSSAGD